MGGASYLTSPVTGSEELQLKLIDARVTTCLDQCRYCYCKFKRIVFVKRNDTYIKILILDVNLKKLK